MPQHNKKEKDTLEKGTITQYTELTDQKSKEIESLKETIEEMRKEMGRTQKKVSESSLSEMDEVVILVSENENLKRKLRLLELTDNEKSAYDMLR